MFEALPLLELNFVYFFTTGFLLSDLRTEEP